MQAKHSPVDMRTGLDWIFAAKVNRLNVLVVGIVLATMFDWVMAGTMREALRTAVVDHPLSLLALIFATGFLATTARLVGEALGWSLAPDVYVSRSFAGAVARHLPRACAFLAGAAPAIPLLTIWSQNEAFEGVILGASSRTSLADPGLLAFETGLACLLIGAVLAFGPKRPKRRANVEGHPEGVIERPAAFASYAILALAVGIIFVFALISIMEWVTHSVDPYSWRHVASNYVTLSVGAIGLDLARLVTAAFGIRFTFYIGLATILEDTRWEPYLSHLSAVLAGCWVAWVAFVVRQGVPAAEFETAFGRFAPFFVDGFPLLFMALGMVAAFYGLGGLNFGISFSDKYVSRVNAAARLAFDGFTSIRDRWLMALACVAGAAIAFLGLLSQTSALPFFGSAPTDVSAILGAPAIVQIWAACAIVVFSPFVVLSHIARIPALTLIFGAAILFSLQDLNDNHEARTTASATAAAARYGEHISLAKWLATRPDRAAYPRYPVFIVATEGGGSRAAYYTANVLAALQDACPSFSQHVLAISSVSGGSVGATVFAAASRDMGQPHTERTQCRLGQNSTAFRDRVRGALQGDLLAPLLSGLLFADAKQRVSPTPNVESDRARRLEGALENAWDRSCVGSCTPGLLAQPLGSLFEGSESRLVVPHLFLNTTEVDTGLAVPIATARMCAPPQGKDASAHGADDLDARCARMERILQDRLRDGADFPISTAAFVSARFPYLTPPATIRDREGRIQRYVDGGYFENSGSFAATRLLRAALIEKFSYQNAADSALEASVHNSQIFVILIRSTPLCTRLSRSQRCSEESVDPGIGGAVETLSPVRTLFATRAARTEYARREVRQLADLLRAICESNEVATQDPACSDRSGDRGLVNVVEIEFASAVGVEIPLTWQLSRLAMSPIDQAVDKAVNGQWLTSPPGRSAANRESFVVGRLDSILCALGAGETASAACSSAQDGPVVSRAPPAASALPNKRTGTEVNESIQQVGLSPQIRRAHP